MKVTIEKQQSLKQSLVVLLNRYRLTSEEYNKLLDIQTEVLDSNLKLSKSLGGKG